MLKALIFDMDGVILDSEPIYVQIEKKLMEQYGIIITDEALGKYVGISDPDMFTDLIKIHDMQVSLEEILEKYRSLKDICFAQLEMKAVPGIPELLEELRYGGIPAAVASSSPTGIIDKILTKLDIKAYFKVISSGETMERGKPFPDIFLKTAELLQVAPEECVVIEDSMHGIKAAAAAGMKCIGFANPTTISQDLSEATCVVDDLRIVNRSFLNSLFED